jgi:hypothetical protein
MSKNVIFVLMYHRHKPLDLKSNLFWYIQSLSSYGAIIVNKRKHVMVQPFVWWHINHTLSNWPFILIFHYINPTADEASLNSTRIYSYCHHSRFKFKIIYCCRISLCHSKQDLKKTISWEHFVKSKFL